MPKGQGFGTSNEKAGRKFRHISTEDGGVQGRLQPDLTKSVSMKAVRKKAKNLKRKGSKLDPDAGLSQKIWTVLTENFGNQPLESEGVFRGPEMAPGP